VLDRNKLDSAVLSYVESGMLLNDAVVPAFTANKKSITHGFPEHSLNMEPDPAECEIEPIMSFMGLNELSVNDSLFNHVLHQLDTSIVNNEYTQSFLSKK
jgi:hypothetical protein